MSAPQTKATSNIGKREIIRALWQLAKPSIVFFVLLTTGVGFFLASALPMDMVLLLHTLLATGLVGAGSLALNQWMERQADGRMPRTAGRPIPAGRISAFAGFVWGTFLTMAGLAYLLLRINLIAASVAALTVATYLFAYTPLKRKTSLCILAGAVSGALPPLIGWSASTGSLSSGAWTLFAIMYLWQIPHFLAIAWRYRDEYQVAGFLVLSESELNGPGLGRRMFFYSLALLFASLLPTVVGLTGSFYFIGALLIGMAYLALNTASLSTLNESAPVLFRASLIYIVLLFSFMVIDKII
ncbi:MAG: heme o synthase [Candidatus Omnitrophota bacterium]|nr:heme o synthase [Candidatus Omnitrophota bacterium]